MSELFETTVEAPVEDLDPMRGMDPEIAQWLIREAKIAGNLHRRILRRAVRDLSSGTAVFAMFHREARDGAWRVDLLLQRACEGEPGGECRLVLIERSRKQASRAHAVRWLNYRTKAM